MDTSKWVRGDEFLAELASARGDPPRPAPDPVDELAQAISYIESRLKRIDDNGLRTKLSPIRAEIIPLKSLDEGGKSWDLSFSLLLLLMVTLAAEGWLAQRSNE